MNKLMKRLRGGVALGSLMAATGVVGGSAVAIAAQHLLQVQPPQVQQPQIQVVPQVQPPQVQPPQVQPPQRPVVPMQTPSVPPTRIEPAQADGDQPVAPGVAVEVQAVDVEYGPTEEEVRSTVELGSSIESVFAAFHAPNGVFPIGDKIIYQWISGKVEGTTEMMTRVHHELLVTTDRNGTILDMSLKLKGQWTGPASIVGVAPI